MPVALALVASAFLHIAALLGPAWELPTLSPENPAPRLEAVLMPAAPNNPGVTLRPHVAASPAIAHAPKPQRTSPRPRVATAPPEAATTEPNLSTEPVAAVSPARPEGLSPSLESTLGVPTFDEPASAEPPIIESTPTPPAVSPPAVPFSLPKKGRMRFIVTRGENGMIIGQSINTWVHDGIHYTFTNITETTGLAALFKPARIVQKSQGEITPLGLRPVFFSNDNERKGKKDTANFDWAGRLITYADRTEPIVDGTQDMLSMYYQLALQAAMDQPMTAIDLFIATGRKLERYHFELIGEETLTYQGHTHATQHLRTKNGDDIIDLWISKTVHGLPLKIRFTDRKGGIFDQIADDASTETTHE
ncbi:MAG: DUF3108 domain-containing protein [Rugosibacter sp.]|nr:DUF3108 domain-containing protein [Rugosibacter sp.]